MDCTVNAYKVLACRSQASTEDARTRHYAASRGPKERRKRRANGLNDRRAEMCQSVRRRRHHVIDPNSSHALRRRPVGTARARNFRRRRRAAYHHVLAPTRASLVPNGCRNETLSRGSSLRKTEHTQSPPLLLALDFISASGTRRSSRSCPISSTKDERALWARHQHVTR